MAVKKRGKKWHFKIRIFGKQVGVATQGEVEIGSRAHRDGDPYGLPIGGLSLDGPRV